MWLLHFASHILKTTLKKREKKTFFAYLKVNLEKQTFLEDTIFIFF